MSLLKKLKGITLKARKWKMKQIKNSRKLSGPNSVIGDTAQLKSHLSKDSIITVERRIATL